VGDRIAPNAYVDPRGYDERIREFDAEMNEDIANNDGWRFLATLSFVLAACLGVVGVIALGLSGGL